jgi:8-oxo-dGTP pyrophosphatase MutT (NUDIX family)
MSQVISAAVVIEDECGRFLLQLRDKKAGIYYPGYWGLFGGACDSHESPFVAVKRELKEELSVEFNFISFLFKLNIVEDEAGEPTRCRSYYYTKIYAAQINEILLREGEMFSFFKPKQLPNIAQIVPLDLSAILIYLNGRVGVKNTPNYAAFN